VIFTRKKTGGFLFAELVVSLSMLGLIIAGLAMSMHSFARFNHNMLLRQRCVSAATAQIESIATVGSVVSDEDIERLWPGIKVTVSKADGTGQWMGLKLLEVIAVSSNEREEVRIKLCRYILSAERGD
jgi:hypothetical protein